MSNLISAAFAAGALIAASSSAMAGPRVPAPTDPSVAPIHLDNPSVPAKQYFEQMQRDGS